MELILFSILCILFLKIWTIHAAWIGAGSSLVLFFGSVLYRPLFLCAVGCFIGASALWIHKSLETQNCAIGLHHYLGEVVSIPRFQGQSVRFDFTVRDPNCRATIRLTWPGWPPRIVAGDLWNLTINIKERNTRARIGPWTYAHWLRSQGVSQEGVVVIAQINTRIRGAVGSLRTLRHQLAQMIDSTMEQHDVAALLAALTMGSDHLLEPETWRILQYTGTTHLISISGLHISFVAGLSYAAMHRIWRFFPQALLIVPAPRAAILCSWLIASIYSMVAGWSVPIQRALFMLSILYIARLINIHWFAWHRLLLTFTVTCLVFPDVLFSMSFWLSFLSIAILSFCTESTIQFNNFWKWIVVQNKMFFALMPITFLFFNQISLISVFANFIAIPYIEFFIVPIGIFATIFYFINKNLDVYIWIFCEKITLPIWFILKKLATFPQVMWTHHVYSNWVLIALFLSIMLIIAPKGVPGKTSALFFLLPFFFYHPKPIAKDELHLTVSNVGNELFVFASTQHHELVLKSRKNLNVRLDLHDQKNLKIIESAHENKNSSWNWDRFIFSWKKNQDIKYLQILTQYKKIIIVPNLNVQKLRHIEDVQADAVIFSWRGVLPSLKIAPLMIYSGTQVFNESNTKNGDIALNIKYSESHFRIQNE